MATSGTVSTTVIDTAIVIESASRRCGIIPSTLSPEDIDVARTNLYLILSSITNRGVNLWCVKRVLVPLYQNQRSYTLPVGTIDLLEAQYRTPAPLAYTGAVGTLAYTATFSSSAAINTCGMSFTADATVNLAFEAYVDADGSWKTVATSGRMSVTKGQSYWIDIDPCVVSTKFRIRETVGVSLSIVPLVFASQSYEVPITRYSRDDYEAQTNKDIAGRVTNYLYDKQLTPVMTLWPVPNDPLSLLSLKVHRQVQDVGTLMQKLEIPERWFEAIIWMLAKNLCYELPAAKQERISVCETNSDKYLKEAEDGETDSAPIYIAPNIRGYTA